MFGLPFRRYSKCQGFYPTFFKSLESSEGRVEGWGLVRERVTLGSQIPKRAREAEGLEVCDQFVLRRTGVVRLQLVSVDRDAERVRLFDREHRALRSRIPFPPIVEVRPTSVEDHVVRARVYDVVPPLRGRKGQMDDRPPRSGHGLSIREGDPDRF